MVSKDESGQMTTTMTTTDGYGQTRQPRIQSKDDRGYTTFQLGPGGMREAIEQYGAPPAGERRVRLRQLAVLALYVS